MTRPLASESPNEAVITLDPDLSRNCHRLCRINDAYVLLHKNAWVPWLILVPNTTENEMYKMPAELQRKTQATINQLAAFSETYFSADKLNIATIGNIVPQLHIHIIARFKADSWWPEPVWGKPECKPYPEGIVDEIRQAVKHALDIPDSD